MEVKFLAVDPHWREFDEEVYPRSTHFPGAGLSYVIGSAKEAGATCIGVEHFFTEKKQRAQSLKEFHSQQNAFIERVINKAVINNCQLVLLTTTTGPYFLVLKIIERFSELKGIKLVIGGSGITVPNLYKNSRNLFFKKPLENLITVQGEGETPIKGIVTYVKDGKSDMSGIPGITYAMNGELYCTPSKKADFCNLSPGDYRDFDLSNFFPILFASHSRGCSGNCTFCDEKDVFPGMRYRSINAFIAELTHFVEEYGTRFLKLTDSTFTSNENEVIEVCNAIITANLDIRWLAYGRIIEVLNFQDSTLELMRRANCIGMHFGFETFEKCVLENVNKGYSEMEQAKTIVHKVRKQDMNVIGSFQIGFGSTNESSIAQSVDYAASLELDVYNYHAAVPPIKQMENPEKYNVSPIFRLWHNDPSIPGHLYEEYSNWHLGQFGTPITMGRHTPMKQFFAMGKVTPLPSAYKLEVADEVIAREIQRAMGAGREKNEATLFLPKHK
ncbi:radical SAM protein [Desulfosporosinus sp. OT]|uniref:B12-binding domain-containing radical SAM protein n=1 Tax=Desulfosporosinus sp. OT TaxID=913865 RepID=UPI000223A592|nr:radical SAM protein [Desulfosporosinus sp. OT]EGW40597.1 radical SAM superfamily protein [Desulfosporosinus sp. OT]